MAIYAIEYEYDRRADVVEAHRPAHRAFLRGLFEEGVVLASGPLRGGVRREDADGASEGVAPAGALLLVRADSPAAALALLDDDPFRGEGLLVSRSAREWYPVVGPITAD
nr:YciI family protein [uncultured Actinotalea sp.]